MKDHFTDLVKFRRTPRQQPQPSRRGKAKKVRQFGWAGAERICLGKVGEMAGAGVVDARVGDC